MNSDILDRLKSLLLIITDGIIKLRNKIVLRNVALFAGVLTILFLTGVLVVLYLKIPFNIFKNFAYYYLIILFFVPTLYLVLSIRYYSNKRLFKVIKPYNFQLYSHLLGAYELLVEERYKYSIELIEDYLRTLSREITNLNVVIFTEKIKRYFIVVGVIIFSLLLVLSFHYRDFERVFSKSKKRSLDKAGILIDVGRIRKEYFFPSYTGMEKLIRYDDKRVIEVLKGTVVRLSVEDKVGADYANIVVNSNTFSMKKSGTNFESEVGLNENGFLRFDFFKRGLKYSSYEYIIKILADENPEIYLTGPEALLRGSMDSKADKKINITFSASDDFGVSRVNIVVALSEGKERSFKIQESVPPQKEISSEYLWDYSEISRYVQGELMFALEVEDNDTISGPKKNRTRFYKIIVPSSSQNFVKEIGVLKQLRSGMLNQLALNLTYTNIAKYASLRPDKEVKREAFDNVIEFLEKRGKRDAIYSELHRIIDELKYYSSVIGSMIRHIKAKKDEKPPTQLLTLISEETKVLEKDILVLQDMIDEVVYFTLSTLSAEIKELRDELKSLMKRYDETKNEELRVNIMAVLNLLEERLKEYREIQSELVKSFSDVNINREALKNLSQSAEELYKNLGELKESLARDEMEKFKNMLSEVDNLISDIDSEFSNMLTGLSSEKYRELMDGIKGLSHDIQNLMDEERIISSELSKLESDIKKRYYNELKNLLDKRIAKIIEMIERLDFEISQYAHIIKKKSRDMKEYETVIEAQAQLKRMPEMLRGYQIFDAYLASNQIVSKMEWIKNVSKMFSDNVDYSKRTEEFYKSSVEIRDKIKEIIDGSKQSITPEERNIVDKLMDRQERNSKEMQTVVSKTSRLLSEFGKSFEKINNDINEAKSSMELSLFSMKKADVPLARTNVDNSISKLDDALKELSKIQSRRSKMMLYSENEEGEGERSKFKTAEVKLPRKEDFKPKERIREEIMKAINEEEIKGYEDFIRRYYEEIIK